MRKFSYVSVLRSLSAYMQRTDALTGEQRARRMPWIAERLGAWALRDRPSMYLTAPMSSSDLAACMNLAWKQMDTGVTWMRSGNPLDLSIRTMLLSQLPYQLPQETGAFARQVDLLRRIGPDTKLYRALGRALGMSPEVYLRVAVFIWSMADERIEDVFSPMYVRAMTLAFGQEAIAAFLRTVIIPHERMESVSGEGIVEDEWFQPNLLYRSPFVTYRGERFYWGRACLQRNIEFAFSDIVGRSADDAVRRTFEGAFESYVGDSLRRCCPHVLSEQEIVERFNVNGSCNDFAVLGDNYIVLVEAKNKALTHTLTATGSAKTYKSKFKATVVKAASQLKNVVHHVRVDAEFMHARIHQVIVTYGDLMLGNGQFIFEAAEDAEIPLVLSIDQLDRLLEAIRIGRCTFDEFFEDYRKHQKFPQTRLFSPGQLLAESKYRLSEQPTHLQSILNPFFDSISALAEKYIV
ncbi:hypothetical protein WS61_05580 [Burkholderia sp. ABCPW 11]|nr:hypothetical protein WS61_05580 [Burkholderia sp. ABCPW 11]